jgi:hypothetical protein
MLLLNPDCTVSGYHLNSHITLPQLSAAKAGHALCEIFFLSSEVLTIPTWGWMERRAKERTTRANTGIWLVCKRFKGAARLTEDNDLFADRRDVSSLGPSPENQVSP